MRIALALVLLCGLAGAVCAQGAGPTVSGLTIAPADGSVTNARAVQVGGQVAGTAAPFSVTFLVDGVIESQIQNLAAGEPFLHGISVGGDGVHTFTVRARDAAGAISTARAGAVTLDTTPPAAPILITPQPIVSNQNTITLKGIHPEPPRQGQPPPKILVLGPQGARFTPPQPQVVTDPNGMFQTAIDVSALPDGTYTFRLIAIDAAGNFSDATQVSMAGKR